MISKLIAQVEIDPEKRIMQIVLQDKLHIKRKHREYYSNNSKYYYYSNNNNNNTISKIKRYRVLQKMSNM